MLRLRMIVRLKLGTGQITGSFLLHPCFWKIRLWLCFIKVRGGRHSGSIIPVEYNISPGHSFPLNWDIFPLFG